MHTYSTLRIRQLYFIGRQRYRAAWAKAQDLFHCEHVSFSRDLNPYADSVFLRFPRPWDLPHGFPDFSFGTAVTNYTEGALNTFVQPAEGRANDVHSELIGGA